MIRYMQAKKQPDTKDIKHRLINSIGHLKQKVRYGNIMKLSFISIEIIDSILLFDTMALKIVIKKNKRHN